MAPSRRVSTVIHPASSSTKGKQSKRSSTTAPTTISTTAKRPSRRSSTSITQPTATSSSHATRRRSNGATTAKGVASGRVEKKKTAGAAAATTVPATSNGNTTTRRRNSGAAVATSSNVTNKGKRKGKAKTQTPAGNTKKGKGKAPAVQDDSMDIDEEEDDEWASQADEDEEMADVEEDNGEEPTKQQDQPILLPRKRRVPLHIVDEKWSHIPDSVQQDISDFLSGVEKTVINTFTSEKRRVEAQGVLQHVKRKLIAQLPKIPVPIVKDMGFNLAKLQEQNRQLEATIRPAITQITTLDESISALRRELRIRKAQLAELKTNAHSEAMLRKQRASAIHPILRKPFGSLAEGFNAESMNLYDKSSTESTYDPSNDPEVLELKRNLESHLDSIQLNIKPVEGFGERVRQTKVVVDEVLERMGPDVVSKVLEV